MPRPVSGPRPVDIRWMVREAEAREAVRAWRASRDVGNGIPVQTDLQAQAGRAWIVRPPASAPSCTGRADSERMGPWASPPVSSLSPPSPLRCSRPGLRRDRRPQHRHAGHHDRRRRRRRGRHHRRAAPWDARPRHARRGRPDDPNGNCTAIDARRGLGARAGSSFAVDLGDGNDRFRRLDVGAPISVAGGDGNDDARGPAAAPTSSPAAPDNDTLQGNGGIDDYFGETGNDIIEARDGRAERISCGAGTDDEADNDFVDIIAECERGIDSDLDGFSTAVDCNDNAANIQPGRGGGVRQRHRRELRRPRQPEPRPRRRRLRPARRLRRQQRGGQARRARDPRQRGRRELRPARGAVRPARRSRVEPVAGHAHAREAALARRPPRAQGRPHRPHLQGQGLPQEADAAPDRLARPPAHRAATGRSGARACASARG